MIVFDLTCDKGHGFEGWFGSSADFDTQKERGLLSCPQCQSARVVKAPMAPSVPRKGNAGGPAGHLGPVGSAGGREGGAMPVPGAPMAPAGRPASGPQALPPQVSRALAELAMAQARALAHSTFVGKDFADRSRAMHYGEIEQMPIHGEASPSQARELLEEGVPVAPLLFPIAPPDQVN